MKRDDPVNGIVIRPMIATDINIIAIDRCSPWATSRDPEEME